MSATIADVTLDSVEDDVGDETAMRGIAAVLCACVVETKEEEEEEMLVTVEEWVEVADGEW